MRQPRQYYHIVGIVAVALLGLVTGLGAEENKASPDYAIVPVGAGSVRLTAPAGWYFQPQRALPDGATSIALVQEKSIATITMTVQPATGMLDLNSLGTNLEEVLGAYEHFRLTRASLEEVCAIPAAVVAGTSLQGGTELQAQIWVLAASGYLWELSLTFPASSQVRPDTLIKQLVGSVRIRSDNQQQWTSLSTSQQALLSYKADQDSYQRARQEPESVDDNQSKVVIRDLDSCLAKVAVGTSLDEDNGLIDVGKRFPADSAQLVVLLQLADAPDNTEITVQLFHGKRLLLQRPILVSGSRKFAVTVYPRRAKCFQPGEYRCQVNVNDQVAWELPLQIGE